MARDIVQELEHYGEYADAVAPAIMLDALATPDGVEGSAAVSHPVRQISYPKGAVVAVAATIVTLVLIGGVALLSGTFGRDNTLVVTQPPPVTTSITQPPATVPVTADGVWVRVPHDEDVFGGAGEQWMESLVVGGPGLVAVGYDTSGGANAAVWTSPDGVTWTRVAHDEGVFGDVGTQWMWSVTAGGPGLVAVGADCASESACDGAVWTSRDGVTWSRVPHDEEIFSGGFMRSVTTGGPGLVAVGHATTFYDGGSESDAAVWTSPDGVTWSRVPHDEEIFGGGGNQYMESVVVGGPGLVAVGADNLKLGIGDVPVHSSAAVWTSPDGVTWTRVAHDETVFGGPGYQEMRSVVSGGPGLVAVGYSDGTENNEIPVAAVWTSLDGVTWTRVADDETVFGGDGVVEMESVAVGGPGLVAVGYHWHLAPAGNDYTNAAVWTSPDGVTWTRVPHNETVFGNTGQQQMESVAVGGTGLVAVGIDASDRDVDGAVWSWTPVGQP